jgi:hypothetical protein
VGGHVPTAWQKFFPRETSMNTNGSGRARSGYDSDRGLNYAAVDDVTNSLSVYRLPVGGER